MNAVFPRGREQKRGGRLDSIVCDDGDGVSDEQRDDGDGGCRPTLDVTTGTEDVVPRCKFARPRV